jgi:hypothetical protein
MASSDPQKLMRDAPVPETRRCSIYKPALPRASSAGDPMDLDLVAFVDAVKKLPKGSALDPLRALGKKGSFEKMIEFANTLMNFQLVALAKQSRGWIAEHPEASQVVALLLLFTAYTPARKEVDRFMELLPDTWPPALEHLRQACWAARFALFTSVTRRKLLARLIERYGD